MAASSAAFNIEIIAYDVLNSFSQACTTFVGQNYGAGKIDRCKKTMFLCLGEDIIASAIAIVLVLLTGKYLLAIFNNDGDVCAAISKRPDTTPLIGLLKEQGDEIFRTATASRWSWTSKRRPSSRRCATPKSTAKRCTRWSPT